MPLPADDGEAARIVSEASKALAFGGLSDLVWGHVSVRDSDGRGLWMKASGLGFEEVEPHSVQLIGWDGAVLVGDGSRHIEYLIHSSIYAARPDVNSVVHAHSDVVNAWCALGVPLRPLTHAGREFTELPQYTQTPNLIRTPELGESLALVLGDAVGVVIPQHGFVMTGADVPASVMRSVLLERAASTFLTALSAGAVTTWMPEDARVEMGWPSAQLHAGYGYLVRRSHAG